MISSSLDLGKVNFYSPLCHQRFSKVESETAVLVHTNLDYNAACFGTKACHFGSDHIMNCTSFPAYLFNGTKGTALCFCSGLELGSHLSRFSGFELPRIAGIPLKKACWLHIFSGSSLLAARELVLSIRVSKTGRPNNREVKIEW